MKDKKVTTLDELQAALVAQEHQDKPTPDEWSSPVGRQIRYRTLGRYLCAEDYLTDDELLDQIQDVLTACPDGSLSQLEQWAEEEYVIAEHWYRIISENSKDELKIASSKARMLNADHKIQVARNVRLFWERHQAQH
jgi:hypothetical protein